MLVRDGYRFHLEKQKDDKAYWCCAERKSLRCKARMITAEREAEHLITSSVNDHSHAPLAFEKEVAKANFLLKTKAKEAQPPSTIIRDTIASVPEPCRVHLPSKAAQKQKIHRVRANTLKEPKRLEEINIPQHLRFVDGELFVLSEAEYDTGRIILLGTKTTIKTLSEAQCWLVDGTFAVVPSIMGQLFSVHGYIENSVVPLIYCLMSSRTKQAYNKFWQELLRCAGEFNITLQPNIIVSDFEPAILLSNGENFPNSRTQGCLFHFGQIIWRRVQDLGLAAKYGREEAFASEVRMIKALSFVPPSEVEQYYTALYGSITHQEARNLAQWFKLNYIGSERTKPRYKPEFWTTGASASNLHFPRTQNSVEAWHRRLKVVVGQRHAGVYKLVSDLAKETIVSKMTVDKLRTGKEPPKSRTVKKYEQLQRVYERRTGMDKVLFLRSIGNNLNLA
ncbi:uncharacterized protein LOC129914472 [Episyrphus balteatus]|uniref:uncharacterized protein LOC129914472 n=1 Tax=Episyrphus balteatus TaxID=286459 RepID=UPI002485B21B|nr:uncharacterized protein LOC129914472 [Episyrphus balteatus]